MHGTGTIAREVIMDEAPADRPQRVYARVAGFMFLLNYALVLFGQLTPAWIRGSGDLAETARRVLAREHLYRGALASMAMGWVTVVVLAFALFVALEPVNRRLALLALLLRVGESLAGVVTVMVSVAALQLRLHAAQVTGPFQADQLQALVTVAGRAGGAGFQIAMTFLGAGSMLFFFLFYRSRWIPRVLAGFGMLASVAMLMVSLATLVFPSHAGTLQYGWAPMLVAEVATALWLLVRGIRPARVEEGKRT